MKGLIGLNLIFIGIFLVIKYVIALPDLNTDSPISNSNNKTTGAKELQIVQHSKCPKCKKIVAFVIEKCPVCGQVFD